MVAHCIVWERADGGVTTEYLADESQLERALSSTAARLLKKYGGPATPHEIDPATLPEPPDDTRFFNAWEWNDRTIVNMPKARVIHMDHIREVRDVELERLDVPYLKAMEAGVIVEQQRVAGLKQNLRDIPQIFDLSLAATPEVLKETWPPELPTP